MKSSIILHLVCVSVSAILLSACAPLEFKSYPDETVPAGATSVNNADRSGTEDASTLPVETRLTLGTLLLEGTEAAVGAEQAAVLLPLWQKWHDLNRSNTATAGDRSALLEEIQAAMTPDQIEAIDAMRLTQADVDAYMVEAARSATPGGEGGGGGFQGFDQTQTLSPEEIATLQSVYRYAGGSRGPAWMLLHELLDLLETKTQA